MIRLSEWDDMQEQAAAIAKEQQEIERRIARLMEAIEAGGEACR